MPPPRNMRIQVILAVVLLATVSPIAPAQPPCRIAVDEPDFAFAAGCLIRNGSRMLMVRHSSSGKLGVPGGFARPLEGAQCVAHRETWEETGLEVIVHSVIRRFANGFALYRCELVDPAAAEVDELAVPASGANEVSQVMWIDPASTKASDWRFPREHPAILELFDQ